MPQELQVSEPSFSSLWAMGGQVEYPTYIIRQDAGRQGPPHFQQSGKPGGEATGIEMGHRPDPTYLPGRKRKKSRWRIFTRLRQWWK